MRLRASLIGVSKQIFGPCAIPFLIEKQTLLKVALMEVLRDVLNVYTANVKQVGNPPSISLLHSSYCCSFTVLSSLLSRCQDGRIF